MTQVDKENDVYTDPRQGPHIHGEKVEIDLTGKHLTGSLTGSSQADLTLNQLDIYFLHDGHPENQSYTQINALSNP